MSQYSTLKHNYFIIIIFFQIIFAQLFSFKKDQKFLINNRQITYFPI